MTLKAPLFQENNTTTQTADLLRLERKYLFQGAAGVVGDTSFQVVQRAAGANMSVDVSIGSVNIAGTESSLQGTYQVFNDAVVNVAVTAANGTNPRKDLVIVRVEDSAYSGASNQAVIEVVAGTPAGSPAEPNLAVLGYKNYYVLAMLDVPALDTTIGTAQITDRRVQATAAGGLWIATSGTRPTGIQEGTQLYEKDTDLLLQYDGTNWVTILKLAGSSSYELRAPIVLQATGKRYTASITGAYTPDAVNGPDQSLTQTGNVTLSNPSNLSDGGALEIELIQDGTGGRTITYPGTALWSGGAASGSAGFITTANAKNHLLIRRKGSSYYYTLIPEWKT